METPVEYDASLARYYDACFTGVEGDVPFYTAYAKKTGPPVLELGCGSGRTLIPIAQAGLSVTGLDCAPAMLDLARQRIAALPTATRRRITLAHGDMADFDLPRRFKLAVIPYRAFQHLLTPQRQVQALLCIRDHLARRGRLVFNIYDPSAEWLRSRGPAGLRRDADFFDPLTGRRVATWYTRRYDPVEQIMAQEFIFEELDDAGQVVVKTYKTLTLRYTFRAEMQYLLELCGYTAEAVYGDFHGGPYTGAEQIWMARRE